MKKTFRKNGILRLLALVALLTLIGAGSCKAEVLPDIYIENPGPGANGWTTDPVGDWRYLLNGSVVYGWQTIGAYRYLFDTSGVMMTGWQTIDGAQYYLTEVAVDGHPRGSLYVSAQTPDGSFVDENGAKAATRANPYGHTCVEIDLTNQTIYVYQNQNLVLSSPCVTGYRGVHDTAVGDFTINYKETETYLKGPTWKAYVHYWMPFYRGQGMHDANWRGTSHENFGGQIYVTDGSHGCVNLPFDVAQKLYSIAYVGMPVHIHN